MKNPNFEAKKYIMAYRMAANVFFMSGIEPRSLHNKISALNWRISSHWIFFCFESTKKQKTCVNNNKYHYLDWWCQYLWWWSCIYPNAVGNPDRVKHHKRFQRKYQKMLIEPKQTILFTYFSWILTLIMRKSEFGANLFHTRFVFLW